MPPSCIYTYIMYGRIDVHLLKNIPTEPGLALGTSCATFQKRPT